MGKPKTTEWTGLHENYKYFLSQYLTQKESNNRI